MCLDRIRHCYSSYMRFWDGENAILVPGRWFRCDLVASVFPHPHAYMSLKTYDRAYRNDGPGEDLREGTEYDKGANPVGYLGLTFCGRPEAFLTGGVSGVDPGIRTDADGWARCCGIRIPPPGGMLLGGSAIFSAGAPVVGPGALLVGGTGYPPEVAYLLPRAKGLSVTYPVPPVLLGKAKGLPSTVGYPPPPPVALPKAKGLPSTVGYPPPPPVDLPKAKGLPSTVGYPPPPPVDLPKAKRLESSVAYPMVVSAVLGKAKSLAVEVDDVPVVPSTNGCRLSLQSGVSVPTGDLAGVNRIYLEPHDGDQIALYVSGAWVLKTVGTVYKDLVATAGKNYDMFAYWTGSAVALEIGPAWTNDYLRATFLARQNGVWVKQGDATRRYLGTFRASGVNVTDDTAQHRWLFNWQNQVPRPLLSPLQSGNWTYTTAAWRQANGNAANHVSVVRGDRDRPVDLSCVVVCTNTGDFPGFVGIGIDSSTTNSAATFVGGAHRSAGDTCYAQYSADPGLGFREFRWLEYATGSGTTTWYGVGAVTGRAGLQGFVWA
jgi:hypothetical protein